MKSKLLVGSFVATSLLVISATVAWAADDWAYWDKQCAPKCATAGADGKPDGGCMGIAIAIRKGGQITLDQRKAEVGSHVVNATLVKQLKDKKMLSTSPVKM